MWNMNIIQVFTNPRGFALDLIKEKRLHIDVLMLVGILVIIYRGAMLGKLDKWIVLRPVISILLFAIAQYMIYRVGGAQIEFSFMINVSIYFHLIVVMGSLFKFIPVISILVFLGIQLLGIYYQYFIGTQLVGANKKFMDFFCGIEIVAAVFSVNYQLLTYLGRCVVYSERTQFFPLIVK